MADMRVVRGPRNITPHPFPPGSMPERWVPGDVVLTHNPRGVFPYLIGFGERLRYRSDDDRPFAWFTHAALVVDPDPDSGAPRLVEAMGTGIHVAPAAKYEPKWFAYIDIGADDDDRRQMVEFAMREAELQEKYGTVQIMSIAGSLVTGGRLTVGMDGSEICSSLVAKALRCAGYWWERGPEEHRIVVDETYLTPADLAASFHTETIRTVPTPRKAEPAVAVAGG